ncbi:MAG: TetR/AcrR family transcriptional regulator [Hyphomonas sp.]|nr:TetR/AcrR family transcriptional regulator [Hyphomonas sp.]
MARTPGARNYNFDAKRAALLESVIDFALSGDIQRPSLRQLAMAAETSEPTLRHYFTDRKGLVIAMMAELGERAQPIWAQLSEPAASVDEAVSACFRHALNRMNDDLFVRMHAFGMVEGMADRDVGQAYLEHVLEPSLDCVCIKLSGTPGTPEDPNELRTAAIAMFSPVIMMSLHQHLLGGRAVAPLDDQSSVQHLSNWLSGAFAESA